MTVEAAPQGPKTLIRLRPAPHYEPPFDDERDCEPFPSAHQLALAWPAPTWRKAAGDTEPPGPAQDESRAMGRPANGIRRDPTAVPATAPDIITAAGTMTAAHTTAGTGRATTGEPAGTSTAGTSTAATSTTGDARLAVRRFVNACVEVLNGYRPAAHLRRLTLPAEAAHVVAQAIAGAHRVADLNGGYPRRPVQRSRRRPTPAAVLRVRAFEPRPGAIEASVVLVTGERTWALALRLELHHDSWVATTLRLV